MENGGQQIQIRIESLLEECIRRKASDIHIQYGLPPILRVDGVLTPIAGTPAMNEEMIKNGLRKRELCWYSAPAGISSFEPIL